MGKREGRKARRTARRRERSTAPRAHRMEARIYALWALHRLARVRGRTHDGSPIIATGGRRFAYRRRTDRRYFRPIGSCSECGTDTVLRTVEIRRRRDLAGQPQSAPVRCSRCYSLKVLSLDVPAEEVDPLPERRAGRSFAFFARREESART